MGMVGGWCTGEKLIRGESWVGKYRRGGAAEGQQEGA